MIKHALASGRSEWRTPRQNAERVLRQTNDTHKPLSTIYIAHEHADHFLGLEVFREAHGRPLLSGLERFDSYPALRPLSGVTRFSWRSLARRSLRYERGGM